MSNHPKDNNNLKDVPSDLPPMIPEMIDDDDDDMPMLPASIDSHPPATTPQQVSAPAMIAPSAPAPAVVPHVEHSYQPEKFVCVRCGSANLTRGMIVDYSGTQFEQVNFVLRRVPLNWLNSVFNFRPRRQLLKLDAVACRDCGAVLLTIDPDALRRAERRRDS
ncbi:MAG: hypothetical protein OHK0023_09750 [Anaerolineae bacterium]